MTSTKFTLNYTIGSSMIITSLGIRYFAISFQGSFKIRPDYLLAVLFIFNKYSLRVLLQIRHMSYLVII